MTRMSIPANVGPFDRIVRIVTGAVLLAMTVAGPRSLWGFIGLLPFLTGLFGFCPLYAALGISTRRRASAL